MDHSNDINNNIASAYLKMLRGEVEQVEEHHEKDADGNTIPHDDEINEDNTNDKSDDGDGMDKVQPKALKKKFKNRKDQDIDNDGDEDESDEYLHNRRKTVSKAIDTDDESGEPVAKTDRRKKLDKKDNDADMEAEGYGKKKMKEAMEKGMPPGEHVFDKEVDGKKIMVHKLEKTGKFCAYVDGKKIGEYDDLKSAKSAAMDSSEAVKNEGYNKKMKKEELQAKLEGSDLDEISKKTLGNYIRRSADDLEHHGFTVGANKPKQDYNKAANRRIGIRKATDRLTKEGEEQARPGTKAQQRAFDKADKTAKPKNKVSLKPMPASLSIKMKDESIGRTAGNSYHNLQKAKRMAAKDGHDYDKLPAYDRTHDNHRDYYDNKAKTTKEDKTPSYLMKRIQEKANHVPQDETRDSFDKQVAGRRLTKTFNNELEGQMTEQEFVAMHDPRNAEVPEFANAPVVHAKTFKSFKDSVKAGPKRSGDNDKGDKNVIRNT